MQLFHKESIASDFGAVKELCFRVTSGEMSSSLCRYVIDIVVVSGNSGPDGLGYRYVATEGLSNSCFFAPCSILE
jgi:hypothetical protein